MSSTTTPTTALPPGPVFFDTSALVPVFLGIHIHHPQSLRVYQRLRPGTGFCSLYTLADLYNTVTRLATPGHTSPAIALQFLADIKKRLSFVKLDGGDYLAAASTLAGQGQRGPLIYDALLLQCARKINAAAIYTWNVRHFQQLAPDLADRIRTP